MPDSIHTHQLFQFSGKGNEQPPHEDHLQAEEAQGEDRTGEEDGRGQGGRDRLEAAANG